MVCFRVFSLSVHSEKPDLNYSLKSSVVCVCTCIYNIPLERGTVVDSGTIVYVFVSLLSIEIIGETDKGFFINLGSFHLSAVWDV